MRKCWPFMVALLAAGAAAAPAHADEWSKKYSVTGKPAVHVETDDGSIDIVSGATREVEAHVITNGWNIPKNVRITESQEGDRVQIKVDVRNMHWVWFGIDHRSLKVEVHVPPEADLEIHSGDGNVTSQSVAGNIRIDTGDGNMDVHGLKGDIHLHSGDGHIEGSDLDGTLNADTGDGHITVRGRFDSLSLRSGDGNIQADAAAGSKIANSWTLHTGDGRINLRLPENFSADLDAHTGDGHISLDFPVTVSGSLSSSSIRGKLNGGGGVLTLTSGDGSIRVEKL
ncbi:MAG: DUF4097 family beta strand repeat-containing protein [Candidatus Acidiferrales bacterium]